MYTWKVGCRLFAVSFVVCSALACSGGPWVDASTEESFVRLVQGGEAESLTVEIERIDGFDGEVDLEVRSLPEGVSATQATIGEGETSTDGLTFEASEEAELTGDQGHAAEIVARPDRGADEVTVSFDVVVGEEPGTLDASFGDGGTWLLDDPALDQVRGLVVVEPGLSVLPLRIDGDDDRSYALAGFDSQGQFADRFAEDGIRWLEGDSERAHRFRALTEDEEGRLVGAGPSASGTQDPFFVVERFDAQGAYDETFGEEGTSIIELDAPTLTDNIVIDDDERVVVLGRVEGSDGQMHGAVARLSPDGTPDEEFGEHGVVVFEPQDLREAQVMGGLSDGSYLIGGRGEDGEDDRVMQVLRLDEAGNIDRDFGEDGRRQVDEVSFLDISFVTTPEDHFVVASGVGDRARLTQFDADGEELAEERYGDDDLDIEPVSVNVGPNGSLYLLGRVDAENSKTYLAEIDPESLELSEEFGEQVFDGIEDRGELPKHIDFDAYGRPVVAGESDAGDDDGLYMMRVWP